MDCVESERKIGRGLAAILSRYSARFREELDAKIMVQPEIDCFLSNVCSAADLVGGCLSNEKIRQMTVGDLVELLYPNGIRLEVRFTRDVANRLIESNEET